MSELLLQAVVHFTQQHNVCSSCDICPGQLTAAEKVCIFVQLSNPILCASSISRLC